MFKLNGTVIQLFLSKKKKKKNGFVKFSFEFYKMTIVVGVL